MWVWDWICTHEWIYIWMSARSLELLLMHVMGPHGDKEWMLAPSWLQCPCTFCIPVHSAAFGVENLYTGSHCIGPGALCHSDSQLSMNLQALLRHSLLYQGIANIEATASLSGRIVVSISGYRQNSVGKKVPISLPDREYLSIEEDKLLPFYYKRWYVPAVQSKHPTSAWLLQCRVNFVLTLNLHTRSQKSAIQRLGSPVKTLHHTV